MPVRFLKAWNNFEPGDIAQFRMAVAQKLVADGIARRLELDELMDFLHDG